MVLEILYWLILILAVIGFFVPEPYYRYTRGVDLVLFVLLGIRVYGLPH
jgi:hypothetical protein